MKIYRLEPRFSPTTGEPSEPHKVFDHVRCDYTGKVIDGIGNYTYPAYALEYGNTDPCWGSHPGESDFAEVYGIELHEFLGDTYDINFEDEADFLRSVSESFGSCLREARVKTAKRLIEEGAVKPEQLEGHWGE